jgi:hypothetical protein
MTKVKAHLVDVDWPVKLGNPCGEINLPVLMEPKQITLLRLKGLRIYDYTESLGMESESVDQDSCTVYR